MSTARPSAVAGQAMEQADRARQPFVYRNTIVLFVVVVACFTAWGIAADMTAPTVGPSNASSR